MDYDQSPSDRLASAVIYAYERTWTAFGVFSAAMLTIWFFFLLWMWLG